MKVLDSKIKIKSKNIINNDNSTIEDTINKIQNDIIKLTPVELYKTSDGSSGTITLNDNVSNYKYIEIIYGADTYEYSVKVRSEKKFTTGCQNVREDYGINVYTSNWSISGNQIVFEKASNRYLNSNNGVSSYGQNPYVKIYEVIGYKEI